MKIHLDNYNLSCSETLFSVLTLTGGALVKRHWSKSSEDLPVCSKWGHRIIAVIEAIPLLGGLVALIEIVAANILCKAPTSSNRVDSIPQITSLPLLPHLEFNIPTILTCSQVLALKIRITTHESELPEYADSIFQSVMQIGAGYVMTRRKKGEAPPLNGASVQIAPLVGPKTAQSNEGLKVRTFCLELLSNIEDLQMAKQSPLTDEPYSGSTREELIRIGEIKGVVRYFLELGDVKKAGFSDFIRLMSFLAERAKEFLPIFKRYLNLVELQEKLSHQVKGRISHWDKIRAMVCSGLFVRTLVETAEPAKKIGLHPIPGLPQHQTIVNLYPIIDAINLLESNHRQAGRWLMHHTRVITFRELCRSIKLSCEQLRDSILGWDDYYLLSIKGKSQEWMADIAYRYLPIEKMPKGILAMDHYSAGKKLFNHITKTHSNNFILFDDGAYSARQFYDYLDSLYFCLTQNGPLKKKKNIYFIFGHFPSDKYIEADFKKFEAFNVNINIISNLLTKNCRSLMDEENLAPSIKMQIEDLASVERPQLATEWKRPDFMSTSLFITAGYLGNYSRARYGELHIADELVEHVHGVGPFTDVIPPYKKAVS